MNKNRQSNIYTGIKYAAVNIFSKKKIEKYFHKKKKINILINMGFYDSKGHTVFAIKSVIYLMKIIKIRINCDIYLGSSCPHLIKIKKIIEENKNFRLFLDKRNIKDLYPNFDLALGAIGMSFLERIHIGVPSIVIPQNKLQEELIRYWKRQDVAFMCDNNIYSILNSMIFNLM